MKVFFNSSIRGINDYQKNYIKIAESIIKLGHFHTNQQDYTIASAANVYNLSDEQIKNLYSFVMRAIGESDAIVLEVSIHSITQGYILHKAIFEKKPVIALHLPGKLPSFALGIETDKLQIVEYTMENLHEQLKDALEFAKEKIDVRFNLFINSGINNYLTMSAQKREISKSAFVRELVEKHRQENDE